MFDKLFGTHTNTFTDKVNNVDLGTLEGVGNFAGNQLAQSGTAAALNKLMGRDASFRDALQGALYNTLAAAAFNAVGDFTEDKWVDGSPQKVAIHAIVGGLLSEATGGDFKTGAIAAGANEALVVQLDALVKNDPNLLTMSSQLVGLVAAAAVDGDIEKGAWVAQNATQYNYLTHAQEAEKDHEMEGCKEDKLYRVEKATKWALIDAQQDLGIVVGVGGGIGLSAAETVEGVLELVQHLPETVKALKQLASSPEFRQQFTDSYVSDLEQRAARLTQAYNDAGWQGSVTAGVEGARFAVELVGVLTAVRGTAQVAAKLPDAAKQVVNAIAEAPASGGWKAQVGAVGDLGKLEVPGGPKGEVSGLLPKPGTTSVPASGIGAGATFKVDSKQLGKKLGKHVEDFGGNAGSPTDRKMVLDKIHDVGTNPEKVIPGTFAGQGANGARGDVFFRIKGNDVVVTKPDGTFVTILKDGVTQNTSVQNALKGGGR
ncbi:DUF637 domain-containing protein [Pseudomonas resinovorans]|nr:DUF637 domain-containing protein [Pseudomonas resinovorans]MDE3739084.1 DUF637 domain-containing protein [Pseudomonas resinovorans]